MAASTSCATKNHQANDPSDEDGRPSSCILRQRRIGRTLALFVLLLFTLTITQTYFYRMIKSSTTSPSSLQHSITKEDGLEAAAVNPSDQQFEPLFYHISPGSTGSRTLYHAACNAGFPSVHHKSFCISSNRGVNGVSPKVVEGVRAHLQVLRLYQIVYKCCSYWDKGIIMQDDNSDSGKMVIKEEGEGGEIILDLCTMSLDDWARDIQTHLSTVLQSSIVGLFDTPYPLMASQVINLTNKFRATPPIIAMTERDAASWANSRSKNHNLMLCKKEFSYGRLGASEFDIIGCVERAISSVTQAKEDNKDRVLRFWDVFEYRSRFEEVRSEFRRGLELQMEHHQKVYRPMADYTPNFFGISSFNESQQNSTPMTKTKAPVTDKQVTRDMKRLILPQRRNEVPFESVNSTQTTLQWKQQYNKPLTCRGAVQYDFFNDSFTELYHHPKTCDLNADMTVGEMINLIQD